jgi:methyl-accepting chemotaxis protein
LGDRIVSIKTTLWEIQTASQQAHGKAKEVEEILFEVQNHKERIDKIAEESEEMKRKISEVAGEAQAAQISVDAFLLAYKDVETRKRLNRFMGR